MLSRELMDEVKEKIPNTNLTVYNIPWTGTAIDRCTCPETEKYVDTFAKDFVVDMMSLIEKHRPETHNEDDTRMKKYYTDVLHHANFGKSKLDVFCGRHRELMQVREYLTNAISKQHSPFIVSGKSGYGKTALLACIASKIPEWVSPNAVTVLRFLGTCPVSSDIVALLQSLMVQICANYTYSYKWPKEDMPHIWDVKRRFFSMLDKVSTQKGAAPLVIILDSVDQMRDDQGVFNMLWLPKNLPQNVYIIVSMLSDRYNCLENTKRKITDTKMYLELEPLSPKTAFEMVNLHLKHSNRQLTTYQMEFVQKAVDHCKQPLFLKLVMDKVVTVNSYSTIRYESISLDVSTAINHLFYTLDVKYGQIFVQHALGYLTCSKEGISRLEMNDVLSCDDEVLNDVYHYHDPPVEGKIRIPALMWIRLRYALREYLVFKLVDGKTVSTWYHRQFWETAEKRYLCEEEQKRKLHSNLADLFIQEDGVKKTIILNKRGGKVIENAIRGVTPQILSSRNLRKLRAVPYHLYHAGRIKDLMEMCLLSFDWIFISSLATEGMNVNKTYMEWLEKDELKDNYELKVFSQMLNILVIPLLVEPRCIAFQMKERLPMCAGPDSLLSKLIHDGHQWIAKTTDTILIPSHNLGYNSPDTPIKLELPLASDGYLNEKLKILVTRWHDGFSGFSMLSIVNMEKMEVIESINTMNLDHFVFTSSKLRFGFTDHKGINVCDSNSGDILRTLQSYKTEQLDKLQVTSIALGELPSNKLVAVALGHENDAYHPDENTHSVLCILEATKDIDVLVYQTDSHNRPAVMKMDFTADDTTLIAVSSRYVTMYQVKGLVILFNLKTETYLLTETLRIDFTNSKLAYVSQGKDAAIVSILNYERHKYYSSTNVHVVDAPQIQCFGLEYMKHATAIICGTFSTTNDKCITSICLWHTEKNSYTNVLLTPQANQRPIGLAVKQDMDITFIGWRNGYITVVDMLTQTELYVADFCEQVLNKVLIGKDDMELYTFSDDNSFRIWDVDKLLDGDHNRNKVKMIKHNSLTLQDDVLNLSSQTQCLDISIINGSCVTVSIDPLEAPSFWKLGNGEILTNLTEPLKYVLSDILKCSGVLQDGCDGGNVTQLNDDIIMHERTNDQCLVMVVTQGYYEPHIISFQVFHNHKSHLLTQLPSGDNVKHILLMLRSNILETYSVPTLEHQISVTLPEVSMTFPNGNHCQFDTNNHNSTRLVVTRDGKYCLILHPEGTETKCMDVVNLYNSRFVKRVFLPCIAHSTLMMLGLSFLVWDKDEVGEPHIYTASDFHNIIFPDNQYCCALDAGRFLFVESTLGIDILPHKRELNVWHLDPLQKLSTLHDNLLIDVRDVEMSRDTNYVVLLCFHKMLSVWSVPSGQCVCKYWNDSIIHKISVSPTASYIALLVHSGLDKKKGVILKAKNLTPKRKTNKYYYREDLY